MKLNKLKKIIHQVPVNYYDQGIKTNIFQNIWHNHKFHVFQKIVKRSKYLNILDVGCASGLMTNKIAQIYPNSKVTGIDIYDTGIKFAKKKYKHLNFVVCDVHKLPFPNNYFDLIVCYETIEHVIDPFQVFKELQRVAKKDASIIIAMDSGNLLFRIVWFFWENTKGRVWKGAHLHPFNHKQLEKLIKKIKFNKIEKKFSHFRMEVIFIIKN